MADEEFLKRIREMRQDTFPLDRMLSYKTVFNIFSATYQKEDNKSIFLKHREYQKFREGYWSLFACKALNKIMNNEHYISFPEDPANDVNFLSVNDSRDNLMNKLIFDVKEFTEYSKDFESFVSEKITPKRSTYGIIIGVMESFNGALLKSLFTGNENDKGVFVILSTSETEQNPYESRVVYFKKDEVLFDEVIDITTEINRDNPIKIYQNVLRDKL